MPSQLHDCENSFEAWLRSWEKDCTSGCEDPNARTTSDHIVEQSREGWKLGMMGRLVVGCYFLEVREG